MGELKNNPAEQADINTAFACLEKLYGELPTMEERGAELVRAKWADKIVELEHLFHVAQTLLNEAKEQEAPLRREFEGAQAKGEYTRIEELRRGVLHAGALVGFRVGPAQNARKKLEDALSTSPFCSIENARESLMSKEDRMTLELDIKNYQEVFASTLVLCESAESAKD